MAGGQSVQWTTRSLLAWIESHLGDRGVDASRVVARHLVAESIGCDVMDLFTDPDRPASEGERTVLRALVARAAAGAPLQQIIGRSGFMLRDFNVTDDVLVPRDATESLVRAVLTWVRGIDPGDRPDAWRMADVGTGSGCIAVTLALEVPGTIVTAIDCCERALAVAAGNIAVHGVEDSLQTCCGDLLEPLVDRVHVIVSNPPYISDERWASLEATVRDHEPETALRGGADGLDVIRRIVASAGEHLLPGGLLALEVDDWHAGQVRELCLQGGLLEPRVLQDAWGDDRIVLAQAPAI